MADERQQVAVFDFDRTLTKRDTLSLFLQQVAGRLALLSVGFRHPVLVTQILLGNDDARDRLKERVTESLLGGRREQDLLEVAKSVSERIIREDLRWDTCARLTWHRSRGDLVVIATASFEPYVEPVAKHLGVEVLLATRWEVGEEGILTGRLQGGNVRGMKKAVVIREYLGPERQVTYAYGDSSNDKYMLAMAQHAVSVGRRKRLRPQPDEHQ